MGEADAQAEEDRSKRNSASAVQAASVKVTLRELRSLTDDEVVKRHDLLMTHVQDILEAGDYRAELDRRTHRSRARDHRRVALIARLWWRRMTGGAVDLS